MPIPDTDPPCVPIRWIARQLGVNNYGDRRLGKYLSLLIAHNSFPPPLPILRGNGLETLVSANSRWRRDAVLAWLHDFLPPANAAQLDAAAMQQAAAEMDASAGNLRLVAGGRA